MKNYITIILPAYNEEKAIGLVIDEIKTISAPCKIIIGDNNSRDRTRDVCIEHGISPIDVKQPGKGNVIRELIRQIDTPYAIMMNSDYTYPIAGNVEKIYALLDTGIDVVICNRKWKEHDAMSLTNRFGNRCLSLLASMLYGYWISDVCTGLWGFKTELLKSFLIRSERFTLEAELFTSCIRQNASICQLPIYYRARLDNSQSKLKLIDGFRIAKFLIVNRF